MENIEAGKRKISVYDDIEDMPVRVFQRFNEHLLQDAEIGSNIADVDKHFRRLDTFLAQKDFDKALQERKNLHQTIWNALVHLDHSSLAFAAIIHSVDGVVVERHDIDSHQKLLDELSESGLTYAQVREVTEAIKKKYMEIYLNISQASMEEAEEWNILQSLRNGSPPSATTSKQEMKNTKKST